MLHRSQKYGILPGGASCHLLIERVQEATCHQYVMCFGGCRKTGSDFAGGTRSMGTVEGKLKNLFSVPLVISLKVLCQLPVIALLGVHGEKSEVADGSGSVEQDGAWV